jgi:hypothetical protein
MQSSSQQFMRHTDTQQGTAYGNPYQRDAPKAANRNHQPSRSSVHLSAYAGPSSSLQSPQFRALCTDRSMVVLPE